MYYFINGRIVGRVAVCCLHHLYHCLVRLLLRTALRELQAQVVTNNILSVEGFSLDYLVFNVSGYTFYTIYTTLGYFTDLEGAGTVVIADLVFVYHSVVMVAMQVYQCCIYKVRLLSLSTARIGSPGQQ